MKKGVIVLATLLIETFVIWLFSIITGLHFIDTMFLGGLLLLGSAWFIYFVITPRNDEYDPTVEYKLVQNMKSLKPFQFIRFPVIWGLSLFLIGSFVITLMKYYSLS